MRVNLLKLNDRKTEFILLGTKANLSKLQNISIKIGDAHIHPVHKVRNLGFHLSANLTVTQHVSNVCSSSYLMMKKLNRVQYLIDFNKKKVLAHTLAPSVHTKHVCTVRVWSEEV